MSKSTWLAFIEPAQSVRVPESPPGAGWIHEIQQDGFRAQLIVQDGAARAYARDGVDCTDRYPAIVAVAAALPVTSAIIDGVVIVTGKDGRADPGALPRAIAKTPEQLVFVAFDLMLVDDEDLRNSPLRERRAILEQLVKAAGSKNLVFSRAVELDGSSVFKAAQQLGFGAIISKWASGRYRSGRRSGWQIAKCTEVGIFEIIGTDKTADGAPVALLAREGRYAGQALTKLDQKDLDTLQRFAESHKIKRPRIPALKRRKTATWIGVGLRAKVRHLPDEPEMSLGAQVFEIVLPREPKVSSDLSSEPNSRMLDKTGQPKSKLVNYTAD